MLNFGDELRSRRHFEAGNSIFWRRAPFSRHHFWVENIIFWRRNPFSSSF
ncbi:MULTISPECIES: hypothetical protein [Bacillaceae]|nr:hypothetical protein [Caldibacillus thermoamylovorans]